MNIKETESYAKDLRKLIVEMTHNVGKKGVHIASALSVADMLAVLYNDVLKYDPQNGDAEDRDFFVLSKGHAYTALYAVLCKAGYCTEEELYANFMVDNGLFPVHPVKNTARGIEFSGGSLGTGVSFAVGKALALRTRGKANKVYTLLGDGECNEGSVWEALVSAAHLKLDNLTIIIDCNKLQQDGETQEVLNMDLESMAKSAGLETIAIDGHDCQQIYDALTKATEGKPKCIIANTVKGKGISFIENNNQFHHAFLTEKQYAKAAEELN